MLDLILKNAKCLIGQNEDSKFETLDLGIKDGKIVQMPLTPGEKAQQQIDLKGLTVLPGLIDTQVHFREPGLTHKEDILHGSRGAVKGGIVSFFEMPNTNPSTTTKKSIEEKLSIAHKTSFCDYAFYLGACAENADHLNTIEDIEGCCGVKIFMGSSTGNLLVESDKVLELAFRSAKKRIALHCEDESRLNQRKQELFNEPTTVHMHPVWRDEQTALIATKKAVEMAHKVGKKIHTLHITTAEEISYLAENKKQLVSVECTPQHLSLSAPECYDRLKSLAQMNPPIREKRHLEALWQGVKNKTIDIIGSDHAPHTLEEKSQSYPKSPSGMPGVQTSVLLMLEHIKQQRLGFSDLTRLMYFNPIKLFGIKGKQGIQIGSDADFTVIDQNKDFTIENSWMETKSGWTPFDGMNVPGFITHTIIRGQVALRDGEIQPKFESQALKFSSSI